MSVLHTKQQLVIEMLTFGHIPIAIDMQESNETLQALEEHICKASKKRKHFFFLMTALSHIAGAINEKLKFRCCTNCVQL